MQANCELVRLAAPAMGTRFELVIHGDDESRLRAAGEAALAEVSSLSERLSAFSAGSMLSYVNQHAAHGPVRVDAELFELLELCASGRRDTEGAFDVTVGPLMAAWGFRGTAGDIEAARRRVWMEFVELDAEARTVRFAREGMRLDLGGVAKGFALDLAARLLRDSGVACALMHGGTSSVIAIGAPPGEDGWRVAAGERVVLLRDSAMSVSAAHGRVIEKDGVVLGHVLDPRVGAPAFGAKLACAVCQSAAVAEVWSTALLVLKRRGRAMPTDVESYIELI